MEVRVLPLQTSNLSRGRQHCLDLAIKDGYTHLLFIDDDMKFTNECFDLLLSRDKDFIAPNCVNADRIPVTEDFDGSYIHSKDKTGIQQIARTGLAFALIKMDKIKNIPRPHFEVRWANNHEGKEFYLPEDYYFCTKLTDHKIDLYIDHDAARKIVHIKKAFLQEDFTE